MPHLSRRLVAALAMLVVLVTPALAAAQQLVLVVRHAERADAGATAAEMRAAPDPPLSAAGKARAEKLAAMLADARISGIYVTEFKRTQQTAEPLAAKLGLTTKVMSSKDTAALIADIKSRHGHDVVLVVAHSDTAPEIIKAFSGPTVTIADDEFDNLFIVVPGTGAFTRIKY